MLSGETIIYFGPEPWEGLWRNRHQLMSRFARENDVYYVEPPTNVRDCLNPGRRSKLFTRDVTGVTVIHGVRWLPLIGRVPLRDVSIRLFLGVIGLITRTAFGRKKPIVWLSKPEMLDYVYHLKAKRKVYHVVDEYSGYGHPSQAGGGEPNARELSMLRSVDTAIVVTESLYKSKSPYNPNTHIVENAVNFDAYASEHPAHPYDMADIGSPIIGYSGLVAARLDLRMIIDAAIGRPDWNFVFVGSVNDAYCKADLAQLRALPNVHMLGTKDVDQVPRYVQHFDVSMIPYRLNLRAQHASPLKLYEYAAASKPIVSTDFPAARAFEGHVRFAGDADELIAECEAALALDSAAAEIVQNREVASANTWEHRVEQLSGILGHGPKHAARPQRPHILYVAEFSTGGSIESLLTLIGGLDKSAFRPTVLFHTMPDASVRKRVEAAGADFIAMYPRESYEAASRELKKFNLQAKVRQLFGTRIEYAYESLKFALQYVRFRLPSYRAIRDQLRTIQPDLVHFNTTVLTDTAGIHAARTCGIPAISHVRDFGNVTYPSVLISRRVKRFICISEAVRDHVVSRGINDSPCVVVPNAVDLERFDVAATVAAEIREEFGWARSDKVFALVGRIVHWKGQDDFIPAIAEARKEDPSIRGLIVGDDSGSGSNAEYIAGLRSMIDKLGIGDSVRFSGLRTDVANVMKAADCVVCASSEPEPFGRVIIEGMAVGTPVIATDAGGASEIVENDVNGLLVPIKDSGAMAAAVLRLAQDSKLRGSICEAALQSVTDHYTVAKHVERVTRIYREVLELEQP
jgi:glycosyltransferase involved in cell wall biosynthesis